MCLSKEVDELLIYIYAQTCTEWIPTHNVQMLIIAKHISTRLFWGICFCDVCTYVRVGHT